MSRRRIAFFAADPAGTPTSPGLGRSAKVFWDTEWEEAQVSFATDGVPHPEADSFHGSDKQDALDTARSWVSGR